MKILHWLRALANNPVESVIFIFSVGLLAFSIYLLAPQDLTDITSPLTDAFSVRNQELLIALIMFLSSIPGLIFPFFGGERRNKMLRLAAFCIFFVFLFLGVLRIMTFGWTPLTWIYNFMIAFSGGSLRLFLEAKKE